MSPIFRQVAACLAALAAACMLSSTLAAAAAGVVQPLADAGTNTRPLNSKADYGYVEVRPGAHMFWTLEPCTGCHHMSIFEEPLIIWLQGGPGSSGSGFGNFLEIGPYEMGWKRRKHTWANEANLLFIDNPVGTGWSYVEKHGKFASDDAGIVEDLMTLMHEWSRDHFEFSRHGAPVYLFCESYGGKMGAGFAKALARDQRKGSLAINFQGVALGDSWISPTDFLAAWGPYLNALSLLDGQPLSNTATFAANAQSALRKGRGEEATRYYELSQETIGNATDDVDWYQVLLHHIPDDTASASLQALWGTSQAARAARHLGRHHPRSLVHWMNHQARAALQPVVPDHVKWGGQANKVFEHLRGDFMVDVISTVDDLLAEGVPVTVYQGQLDLICCTLGAEAWMAKLRWPGMKGFQAAKRRPFYTVADDSNQHAEAEAAHHEAPWQQDHQAQPRGQRQQRQETPAAGSLDERQPRRTAGFVREHGPLALITVMSAGHMIPIDQPRSALRMVRMIMDRHSQVSGGQQPAAAFDNADSAF